MAKKSAGPRKTIDSKHVGIEPDLRGDYERVALAQAYNWYNYQHDSAKAKEFALHYLRDIKWDKNKIKALAKVDPKMFINNVGWNARILTLGGNLPEEIEKRMFANIDRMIENVTADVPVEPAAEKVVISIQDRIKEKINTVIAEIELELQKQWDDPNYEFKMYDYLKGNEIKPMVSRAVADYYIPLFNEYIDAASGEDTDLKEAYSGLPKKLLMGRLKFIESIVNDAETWATNVKKARAPRKPKPKSVTQVVSKIKFKETDDKYKITSVRPVDIVGADQLWVFNTKTRFLAVYASQGPAGLTMKGTKIQNFDPTLSIAKKLRKPEDTLQKVLTSTKAQLKKVMDAINSKPKTLNGRINSDTLLLRITK